MSNQDLTEAGAAGSAVAFALLDALIAKEVLSKADALAILGDAQRNLANIYKPHGAAAAGIVARVYERLSENR